METSILYVLELAGFMIHPRLAVVKRLFALLIGAAIWFLSSQSILPQPKGILGFDKLQHLVAYLVLAAAIGLWFPSEWRRKRRLMPLILTALISSIYGIVDEVHQFYVPGRDCNVWDWLADTAGAILGSVIIMLVLPAAKSRLARRNRNKKQT